jgi:hypothetical protein
MVRSIEKSNDLIGNRTRDLPACGILPQPTTLPHTSLLLTGTDCRTGVRVSAGVCVDIYIHAPERLSNLALARRGNLGATMMIVIIIDCIIISTVIFVVVVVVVVFRMFLTINSDCFPKQH